MIASILKNATEEEPANAVEENVVAIFRSMAEVLEGELEETPALARYHAAPLSVIFKGAFRANLAEHKVDAAIQETIEADSPRLPYASKQAIRFSVIMLEYH